MRELKNREAAEVADIQPSHIRKMRSMDLKPLGKKDWTPAQAIALGVRVSARRAGASKAAADAAYRLLSFADLGWLRSACSDGKRYLRLLGDVCDANLFTEKVAFDPAVMAKATQHRLPHVIVDLKHWLGKLDAVSATTKAERDEVSV